jgi:hypothetical protein
MVWHEWMLITVSEKSNGGVKWRVVCQFMHVPACMLIGLLSFDGSIQLLLQLQHQPAEPNV